MTEATAGEGASTGTIAGSFDSFYRSARDSIYRSLAVTLRDHALAQEATDEAMARAYQRWAQVEGYGNPEGWVYRVALNWARSRLRRIHRERSTPVEAPTPLEPAPADPEMATALSRLSDDHRAVIVLRYLHDLSQEMIAERLDLPIGTVRSRLHRALEILRKEVTP